MLQLRDAELELLPLVARDETELAEDAREPAPSSPVKTPFRFAYSGSRSFSDVSSGAAMKMDE